MPKISNVYQDKERGTYYTIVSLGTDDLTGKRISKTKRGFTTQKEAKKWHDEYKLQHVDISRQGNINFKYFLNEYFIPDYRQSVQARTYDMTKSKLKRLKFFDKKRLDEITPALVKKFQNDLYLEGLSNNYIRSVHQILQQVFDLAIKLGYLNKNAAKIVGNVKKEKPKVDFWTREEFQRFINTFDKSDLLEYQKFIIFWFFFMTGIRTSELQALTWSDLDFKNETIYVHKSMYYKNKDEYTINDTKTLSSTRLLYLDKDTINYMMEWKERQKEVGNIDFIFSLTGLPLVKSTLSRIISIHAEFAGVKKIRVHDLRHSHASLMLELGMNSLEMQNRLGHADIKTTLGTYSHLRPNAMKEVANKFFGQISVSGDRVYKPKFNGNQHTKNNKEKNG
ncbi:tyrosine-type recombinase/integrase [Streptococcaceae bacterium ESL0729]|nr:tyrosine-type recombinase/integrase [Streptococcaceae bacterium ESL0729]